MFGCGGGGGVLGVVLDSVQSLTQQLSQCVVLSGTTPTGETCEFTLTNDLILSTTS